MKIHLTLTIILTFMFGILNAQTVEELYNKRDLKELIKFADKSEELTKEQLYCVEYSFFQLENDKRAIEMPEKVNYQSGFSEN